MNPVQIETLLIADDHELIRQGVRMIIESLPQKYHIIEADTCAKVIQLFSNQQVHHCVLDMFLADGNLFSSVDQITSNRQTNILVYSMNAEKIYAGRLMQKGVRGFVSKQAPIQELESAIMCLLKGEMYLSPGMKEGLFKTGKTNLPENPIDTLSDRELEVVEYVAIGMGAKEIANKMNLDITTVSTYRRRAFEKLDVQNMIELKDKFLLYKMQG
jgi:two-component system, NarL family, invasion response regulator UvrY